MKKPALQSKRVGVLQMAFLTRKVFGTCEKRAPERDSNPDLCNVLAVLLNFSLCLSNTDNCEDHLHWNHFNLRLKYINFMYSHNEINSLESGEMSEHTYCTPCWMKMFDQTMFSCLANHHCFWWIRRWMKTFQHFSRNFMVVLLFSVWNYLQRCRGPFVVSSFGAHVRETRSGWHRDN